jgi:tRNA uridine 5-carboxymethylaminomethyl modification enzyme
MFTYPKTYDVIVVGAGHAGTEAALATARMGCSTLLLSMNLDTIGQMSCNPAIGGLAKGHLVREIDALGGEMARVTDLAGLQFRTLNTKKGPSVWATRVQCDKKAYQFRLKWVCERQPNLDLKQAQSTGLIVDGDQIRGVETSLEVAYRGRTVILTTGTFLQGLLHIGGNRQAGGRAGEGAASGMSGSLKSLGFELGRLKTGTPPRLVKRSIDFARTEAQPGDEPVPYFSLWKDDLFHVEQSTDLPSPDLFHVEQPIVRPPRRPTTDPPSAYPPRSILARHGRQLPCHLTRTTQATADIIRANLHRSPLYSGRIEGIGPRYCPSIEDKIVRFAEKESHQIFLEPEGVETDEIYVNGCSTSMPYEVQTELVRTIVGCEHAEIMRPAYAVEYDFVHPTQLCPSLETKRIRNLYLAGQINGTSGYEEAAAQGLMAGINAVLRLREMEPVVLGRHQAYIGVLIDDLVTKGTREPYRMFTSRAEHRLLLRQDNADLRLSELGHAVGLLPDRHYRVFLNRKQQIECEIERLRRSHAGGHNLEQLLRRPEMRYASLPGADLALPLEVREQVEIQVKYAGYIERQQMEVDRYKSLEDKKIPDGFDFGSVRGLRHESSQKLLEIQPRTVGQASRISGITPADIGLLCVWLKRAGG